MGQLTDSLRATLRDLAQSDVRLYRGLQEELGDTSTSQPTPVLAGEARASREALEGLSQKALWELCKQRGIKGLSNGPKPRLIDALLNHPDGPPLRSALPAKSVKGSKSASGAGNAQARAGAAELQALERRLDRLERLVLLIANQVGVSPEAIARLATTPALPPT